MWDQEGRLPRLLSVAGERRRIAQRVRSLRGDRAAGSDATHAQPRSGAVAEIPGAAAAGGTSHRAPSRRPSGRQLRVRIDPGRRGALAAAAVALLAALLAGGWLALDRPHADPLPVVAGTQSPGAGSGSGSVRAPARPPGGPASSQARVVIDVAGRVRKPGVYRLAAGSRVDDALRAAGGSLPGVDVSGLNLARVLTDGEQISVGVPPAPDAGTPATGTPGPGGLVDLNTATLTQLDGLPGVGPVLAQHILDWRAAHSRFDSVDQLREVSGIGPAKFADLHARVRV